MKGKIPAEDLRGESPTEEIVVPTGHGPAADEITQEEVPAEARQSQRPPALASSAIVREEPRLANLVMLSGGPSGQTIPVNDEVTIGRAVDVDLFVDSDEVSRRHARVFRGADGHYYIEDLGSRNGTVVNGHPVNRVQRLAFGDRLQFGSHIVLLFSFRDPVEEQLADRQRLESVNHIAAGIAHDFNNLIGVVSASLDYLRTLPLDELPASASKDARDSLADADAAAHQAAELAKRLLSLARPSDEWMINLDLGREVTDVAALARRLMPANIEIHVDAEPHLLVRTPTDVLNQITMNLCVNARDAMPDGGNISIEVRRATSPPADMLPTGRVHLLTVSDTGTGMTPEVRRRAFEPFFTTKKRKGGSGLGLATVYSAVRNLGGHVELKSEPGRGTSFRIYLPEAPPVRDAFPTAALSRPTGDRPANDAAGPLTILVVDDHELLLRSTARVLRQAGHEVHTARTGDVALEIVSSQRGGIDLAVCDLHLDDMGGEALIADIKRIDPTLKVLVYAGMWDAKEAARLSHSTVGFVRKPANAQELRETVARIRPRTHRRDK